MGDGKDEITIESTDEDRSHILSNMDLTVVQWDKKHGLRQTEPNESVSHALGRYMDERGLRGKIMEFKDFPGKVAFSRQTLHESIRQMTKRHGDLANLGRLLSVVEDVCKNAIKTEVEPYRHQQPKTGAGIKQMHQYISAFHDMDYIYPVKITIREAENSNANKFYMVITVGMVDIEDKIKEALTNTRVHPNSGESLPAGDASFDISIPEFVKTFNRDEGIILKNLPDGILSEEQQNIKQKIIEIDSQKELQAAVDRLDKVTQSSEVQINSVRADLVHNRNAIKEQAEEIREEARMEANRNSIHMR